MITTAKVAAATMEKARTIYMNSGGEWGRCLVKRFGDSVSFVGIYIQET